MSYHERLERLEWMLHAYIKNNFADELIDGKVSFDAIGNGWNLQLSRFIYAKDLAHEWKYPRGLWQALRERFFPKWWLKRHPVDYVRVRARQLFPWPEEKVNPRLGESVFEFVGDGSSQGFRIPTGEAIKREMRPASCPVCKDEYLLRSDRAKCSGDHFVCRECGCDWCPTQQVWRMDGEIVK